MKIKELQGKIILDSRNEKTIEISLKNNLGTFIASSPSGKSKGRYEKPAFVNKVEDDIKTIADNARKIAEINFEEFKDLEEVEKIVKGKIGANSLFALETVMLKALAVQQGKKLWQVINEKVERLPHPIGNCLEGGMHARLVGGLKPDFQEFLVIPMAGNFSDDVFIMKKMHENIGKILESRKAKGGFSDEQAWSSNLKNEEALEILNLERENLESETDRKIKIGIDIAASTFYSQGHYDYKNGWKRLNSEEQTGYISSLAKEYDIFYMEDPLQEEDFSGFKNIREQVLGRSIVIGDDLTVSNKERFLQALKNRSVDGVILKPNQTGSLLEIKELAEIAKRFNIITIMSHRSGETEDYSLADLAFGFQTNFIKTGIAGKEREIKLRRMIEIEKSLSKN